MNTENSLRDRLLSAESASPDSVYSKKLQELLESNLSTSLKVSLILSGLLTFGLSIWFCWLGWSTPNLPMAARAGLFVGAILAVAWSFMSVKVVKSGVFHRRKHNAFFLRWSAINGWLAGVLLVTLGLDHPDLLIAFRLSVSGLAAMLSGSIFLFRHVLDEMELNQRERMLEIQIQLAGLKQV